MCKVKFKYSSLCESKFKLNISIDKVSYQLLVKQELFCDVKLCMAFEFDFI